MRYVADDIFVSNVNGARINDELFKLFYEDVIKLDNGAVTTNELVSWCFASQKGLKRRELEELKQAQDDLKQKVENVKDSMALEASITESLDKLEDKVEQLEEIDAQLNETKLKVQTMENVGDEKKDVELVVAEEIAKEAASRNESCESDTALRFNQKLEIAE